MAKNILIIGSGGRESAIEWKVRQDGHRAVMKTGSHSELIAFAKKEKIDLTIVGSDQYLADGIVDKFQALGFRIFGPTQKMAQIEASKQFAKDIMQELGIPTARQLAKIGPGPVVIKKDGLALGKGVQIIDGPLVIEEFLEGMEVSAHAFCDGKTFKLFPIAQDHKTIYDGDKGPMTGGMGSVVPVPDIEVSYTSIEKVVQKIVKKLKCKGVLFPGLMITKSGPKVLEFNARFGDPETQSYMRLLKTDLVDIADACIDGALDKLNIEWHSGAAATVVMASAGYPGAYEKGLPITGIDEANALPGVVVFDAGIMTNGELRMTNGGRVLGVSATGKNLKEAIALAYKGVKKIDFEGKQYRKDIGSKILNT